MPDKDTIGADKNIPNPTQDIGHWVANSMPMILILRPSMGQTYLLDWLGVTLVGARIHWLKYSYPMLLNLERGQTSLIGSKAQTTPTFAAMINGAASHALDYDDVNKRLHGHPTVPVVPALLAMAQQNGASGRKILDPLL